MVTVGIAAPQEGEETAEGPPPPWIVRHQRKDGWWSGGSTRSTCGLYWPGSCDDGVQEIRPAPLTLTAEDLRWIDRRVESLGGDEIEEREWASEELASKPEAASYLQRRLPGIRDPEARTRATAVLRRFECWDRDARDLCVTAAAMTALISAGYTHLSRESAGIAVRNSASALTEAQRADGTFLEPSCPGGVLAQVQAASALCELYWMTESARFRDPAREALAAMISLQREDGAWARTASDDAADPITTFFACDVLVRARDSRAPLPERATTRLAAWVESKSRESKSQDLFTILTAILATIGFRPGTASPLVRGGMDVLHSRLAECKSWGGAEWYAATRCFMLFDGSGGPYFKALWKLFKEKVVAAQFKGRGECRSGSFPMRSALDRELGPVWSNALVATSFSIAYYRPGCGCVQAKPG